MVRLNTGSPKTIWIGVAAFGGFLVLLFAYAAITHQVNDQAVDAVTRAVAKAERVTPPDIEVRAFEYRPGFKGKYVQIDYTSAGTSARRHFLIRKPLTGTWKVTYEIDDVTYNKDFPGSGPPTRFR